jgi:hypothetical protein
MIPPNASQFGALSFGIKQVVGVTARVPSMTSTPNLVEANVTPQGADPKGSF